MRIGPRICKRECNLSVGGGGEWLPKKRQDSQMGKKSKQTRKSAQDMQQLPPENPVHSKWV